MGTPSKQGAAAPAYELVSRNADAPSPEDDFDALHAALGELPAAPTTSSPPTAVESQGRSSAAYCSARPHAIPVTRAPAPEGLNQPAVIVRIHDTTPMGPSQQKITVPTGKAAAFHGPPSSGPHPAAPSAVHPVSPPPSAVHPVSPPPFAAAARPAPERVITEPGGRRPVRPRTPRATTIVVRKHGPTKQQKLVVFVVMLFVFVGGGIALLVYGEALGVDLGVRAPTAPSQATGAAATTAAPPSVPSPTTQAVAPAPPVATQVASPTPVATVISSMVPSAPVAPPPPIKKGPR